MGFDNISYWCKDCKTEAEDCRACSVPAHGEPSHHKGDAPITIARSEYVRLKESEKRLKEIEAKTGGEG